MSEKLKRSDETTYFPWLRNPKDSRRWLVEGGNLKKVKAEKKKSMRWMPIEQDKRSKRLLPQWRKLGDEGG
jgi:hypothetical protein